MTGLRLRHSSLRSTTSTSTGPFSMDFLNFVTDTSSQDVFGPLFIMSSFNQESYPILSFQIPTPYSSTDCSVVSSLSFHSLLISYPFPQKVFQNENGVYREIRNRLFGVVFLSKELVPFETSVYTFGGRGMCLYPGVKEVFTTVVTPILKDRRPGVTCPIVYVPGTTSTTILGLPLSLTTLPKTILLRHPYSHSTICAYK